MLAIDSLLHRQRQTPDCSAFVEADRQLGYHDLFLRAERLGALLALSGVTYGERVGIAQPRGIDAASAIYATLFCGAIYVPLDPIHPASRLASIVKDAACRAIVGRGGRPEWCQGGVVWIDLDDVKLVATSDKGGPDVVYRPSHEDIAAILYTSGSTGKPKGVSISFRAIDAFVRWATRQFALDESDRIASLAPFFFDLSLFDLFAAMQCGATTLFMPAALTLAPNRLVQWLEAQQITTWYTVPSLLGFLALKGGLEPGRLPRLRRILFAGEVFPLPGLRRLAAALPHVELANLFGPTETNVCSWWPVDRARLHELSALPIGGAACEADLAIDESGELLARGPCLMSGYWLGGTIPQRLEPDGWYRTGDLVSRNDRGELLYHGRKDRMIKSAGYRVEPAEIEAALEAFPGVHRAVAFGMPDAVSGQRIVAAVIVDGEPEPSALFAFLKSRLAPYMIPARIRRVDELPLLTNGKTDLVALEQTLREEME